MASFKDAAGREWLLKITAPVILQVRAECDPDFLLEKGDQENTYDRLRRDPVLLCRVMYVLCSKQRLENGLSEEQFYLGIIGDAIDEATRALHEAIQFFIPRRSRELAQAIAAKTEKMADLTTAQILQRINDANLEASIVAMVNEKMDEALAKILTPPSSVSSTPDSAEPVPTNGP